MAGFQIGVLILLITELQGSINADDIKLEKQCTGEQRFDSKSQSCICVSPNTYFDTTTGGCDPCSQICENADKQRTVEDCIRECPEMAKEMGLKNGIKVLDRCTFEQHWDAEKGVCVCNKTYTYLDEVTGRCDPCSQICVNAKEQRLEKECKEKCGDFKLPVIEKSAPPRPFDLKILFIIVPIIVGVLVIVTILYCKWRWCKHALERFKARMCPNRKIRQEEGGNGVTANGKPYAVAEDDGTWNSETLPLAAENEENACNDETTWQKTVTPV